MFYTAIILDIVVIICMSKVRHIEISLNVTIDGKGIIGYTSS